MATSGTLGQWIALLYSLTAVFLHVNAQELTCSVDFIPTDQRLDCGSVGSTEAACLATPKCCWDSSQNGVMWCYESLEAQQAPAVRDCTNGRLDFKCDIVIMVDRGGPAAAFSSNVGAMRQIAFSDTVYGGDVIQVAVGAYDTNGNINLPFTGTPILNEDDALFELDAILSSGVVSSNGNLAMGLRTILEIYQQSSGARSGVPRVATVILTGPNTIPSSTSAYRTFLRYDNINVVFVDVSGANSAMLSTLNPAPTVVTAFNTLANTVCSITDAILLQNETPRPGEASLAASRVTLYFSSPDSVTKMVLVTGSRFSQSGVITKLRIYTQTLGNMNVLVVRQLPTGEYIVVEEQNVALTATGFGEYPINRLEVRQDDFLAISIPATTANFLIPYGSCTTANNVLLFDEPSNGIFTSVGAVAACREYPVEVRLSTVSYHIWVRAAQVAASPGGEVIVRTGVADADSCIEMCQDLVTFSCAACEYQETTLICKLLELIGGLGSTEVDFSWDLFVITAVPRDCVACQAYGISWGSSTTAGFAASTNAAYTTTQASLADCWTTCVGVPGCLAVQYSGTTCRLYFAGFSQLPTSSYVWSSAPAISGNVGDVMFGAPLLPAITRETAGMVVMFPDLRFRYDTALQEFQFMATRTGTLTFCVFRLISGDDYYVVYQQEQTVVSIGGNIMAFSSGFVVRSGDVIGIAYSQDQMPIILVQGASSGSDSTRMCLAPTFSLENGVPISFTYAGQVIPRLGAVVRTTPDDAIEQMPAGNLQLTVQGLYGAASIPLDVSDSASGGSSQSTFYVNDAETQSGGAGVRQVLVVDPLLTPLLSSVSGCLVIQMTVPADKILLWDLTQDTTSAPAIRVIVTPTGGIFQVGVYYRGFGSTYVVSVRSINSRPVITLGITIGADYSGEAVTIVTGSGGISSPLFAGNLGVLTLVDIRPASLDSGETIGNLVSYPRVLTATQLAALTVVASLPAVPPRGLTPLVLTASGGTGTVTQGNAELRCILLAPTETTVYSVTWSYADDGTPIRTEERTFFLVSPDVTTVVFVLVPGTLQEQLDRASRGVAIVIRSRLPSDPLNIYSTMAPRTAALQGFTVDIYRYFGSTLTLTNSYLSNAVAGTTPTPAALTLTVPRGGGFRVNVARLIPSSLYCSDDGAPCDIQLRILVTESGTTYLCPLTTRPRSRVAVMVASGDNPCAPTLTDKDTVEFFVQSLRTNPRVENYIVQIAISVVITGGGSDRIVSMLDVALTINDPDASRPRLSICFVRKYGDLTTITATTAYITVEGEIALYSYVPPSTGEIEVVNGFYRRYLVMDQAPTLCAIFIRSEDDVYVIDACGPTRAGQSSASLAIKLYQNGALTPGFLIQELQNGQSWTVTFPSGTRVNVAQITGGLTASILSSSSTGIAGACAVTVGGALLNTRVTVSMAGGVAAGASSGATIQYVTSTCLTTSSPIVPALSLLSCAGSYSVSSTPHPSLCTTSLIPAATRTDCDHIANPNTECAAGGCCFDNSLSAVFWCFQPYIRGDRLYGTALSVTPIPRDSSIVYEYSSTATFVGLKSLMSWENGLTQAIAVSFCQASSAFTDLCNGFTAEPFAAELLDTCCRNIKVTALLGDTSFGENFLLCRLLSTGRTSGYDPAGVIDINALIDNSCPDDCSGDGTCVRGVCQCNIGNYGPSCSSQVQGLVLTLNSQCDVARRQDCYVLRISSVNFDPATQCSINFGMPSTEVQAYGTISLVDSQTSTELTIPNQGTGTYTINCRRGTIGTPVSVTYAVYNSACQIVNGVGAVVNRNDVCVVGTLCYPTFAVNPSNRNQWCTGSPLSFVTASFVLLIMPPFTFDESISVWPTLPARESTTLSVSSSGPISFRPDPDRDLGSGIVYFGPSITIGGLPSTSRRASTLSMVFQINADPGQSNARFMTFSTPGVGEGFSISITGGTTLVVQSGTLRVSGTITPGTWNIIIIIFNRVTGQFILNIDGTTVQTINLVSSTMQLDLDYTSIIFGESFLGSLFGFSVTDIALTGPEISATQNWESITIINRASLLMASITPGNVLYDFGTGLFSVQALVPSTVQVVYRWLLNGVPQGSVLTRTGTGITETFTYTGTLPTSGILPVFSIQTCDLNGFCNVAQTTTISVGVTPQVPGNPVVFTGLSRYPGLTGLSVLQASGVRGATLDLQVELLVGGRGLTGNPNSVVQLYAYQIVTPSSQQICAATSSPIAQIFIEQGSVAGACGTSVSSTTGMGTVTVVLAETQNSLLSATVSEVVTLAIYMQVDGGSLQPVAIAEIIISSALQPTSCALYIPSIIRSTTNFLSTVSSEGTFQMYSYGITEEVQTTHKATPPALNTLCTVAVTVRFRDEVFVFSRYSLYGLTQFTIAKYKASSGAIFMRLFRSGHNYLVAIPGGTLVVVGETGSCITVTIYPRLDYTASTGAGYCLTGTAQLVPSAQNQISGCTSFNTYPTTPLYNQCQQPAPNVFVPGDTCQFEQCMPLPCTTTNNDITSTILYLGTGTCYTDTTITQQLLFDTTLTLTPVVVPISNPDTAALLLDEALYNLYLTEDIPSPLSLSVLVTLVENIVLSTGLSPLDAVLEVLKILQTELEVNGVNNVGARVEDPITLSSTSIVLDALCPINCNGNGLCMSSVCVCNDGFDDPDCAIEITVVPTVSFVNDYVCCDNGLGGACIEVVIYGYYINPMVRCRVQTPNGDTTYPVGTTLTPYMALCPVSYRGNDYLLVAIANPVDGVTNPVSLQYSGSVRIYRPNPDLPRCLICTPASTPLVREGTCLISGSCYDEFFINPADPTEWCRPVTVPIGTWTSIGDTCLVANRVDCGYVGITEANCVADTNLSPPCCFSPSSNGDLECFFPLGTVFSENPNCATMNPVAGTTPLCFPNDPNIVISQALCIYRQCCYVPGVAGAAGVCYSGDITTTTTTTPTTTTITTTTPLDECAVSARRDCGYVGISEENCVRGGLCCYETSGSLFCFFKVTVPTPIIQPAVCTQNTNTLCAADPDPRITQDKCHAHGCCWDQSPGGAPQCYDPAGECAVTARRDCGYTGISEANCVEGGLCCSDTSGSVSCFFKSTVPTTITQPAVCTQNTNARCAAAPDPRITQVKCNAHGCCWDTLPTNGAPQCYDPAGDCAVSAPRDCGYTEISEANCAEGGLCCFDTSGSVSCFFKSTIPTTITQPAVCTQNTNTRCAAALDPRITEVKCNAHGCCWDQSPGGAPQCYDPAATTTTETTTTTVTTTTTPVTTTTAQTGLPGAPDPPVIVVIPDLSGLTLTGIDPPPMVNYFVTWYLNDIPVQTSVVDSPNATDAMLDFGNFNFNNNPEIEVCIVAAYDGATEFTEPVCTELYRVVQVFKDPPFDEEIVIYEGFTTEIPFRLVGVPDLICGGNPSHYRLEVSVVVDGESEVSCGPDGVAFVNQGASLMADGSPAGSCSFTINNVPSSLDVNGVFHLTGVVDNRVDDDEDFTIRIQVTKVAYQGLTSFGSCTVDAAVCNVTVKDKSPGAQACKVGYPFNIQTFNYESISSNLVNVFVLLKHKDAPFEIHIMTKAVTLSGCSTEIAVLCGVAVRSGSSVIMISRCGGPPGSLGPNPPEVRALLPDSELKQGTKLYRNRQSGYTIISPYGSELRVSSGEVGQDGVFSLIYSPSPLDVDKVEGLCGDYTGPVTPGYAQAVNIVDGNAEVHQWRVISFLNIFNQPGFSGAPGPEDWCSCQDSILGTNCYRTPYDRCDLTLRPVNPRLLIRSSPDDARIILAWTDSADTTPVGPLVTFVPPNPFTPYDAYAICEQKILISDLARVCKPLLPLEFQVAYEVCLDLIGRTSCDSGVALIVEVLKSECLQFTSTFVEIPDEVEAIFSLVCPNDCGDYGYCLDTRCICSAGFSGPNCEQPPDAPPMLTGIKDGGACIPDSTNNCGSITIYGSFNPSLAYTCCLQFICPLTGEELWGEVTYPASSIQRSEINCPVPGGRSALITIKDSRGRSSANSLPFIVYDPDCLRCSIMNTYHYQCMTVGRGCYIMKQCYKPNSPHPRDEMCRSCDPAQNHTGWTRREGEDCALPVPPEPGTQVSPTTFLLLVSLSVFLGLLFIIIFACMCHRATTICRTVNGLEQSEQCLCDQSTGYGSAGDGSTIYSGSEKRTWGVYALRDNWNYGHSHNHHH